MRLAGKVAVIVGGGSGMGEAIALLFSREGAKVVVADIEGAKAESVAARIAYAGGSALAVRVDIVEEKQVHVMVSRTLERFHGVDVLVNCAATGEYMPAEEITAEKWRRMLDINLTGTFYTCREAGREMIRSRSGKIINFSSTAGVAGVPYMAHYCAAKHGVVGLTRALAAEWGKHNINVNCICPGATLTNMLLNTTSDAYRAERAERVPLNRLATPEDQANVALFLASSESDYINGGVLCVDGGIFALAASTSAAALKGEH